MCGLLEGLLWGRPGNEQLRPGVEGSGHSSGSPHSPACRPCNRLCLCLLGPASAGLAVTILCEANSPGFLHSGPRNSLQEGQVWASEP